MKAALLPSAGQEEEVLSPLTVRCNTDPWWPGSVIAQRNLILYYIILYYIILYYMILVKKKMFKCLWGSFEQMGPHLVKIKDALHL